MPVRLSVLPDWLSLHAALLFLPFFRLVRSRFGALNAFLRFVCLCRSLLFGFSLPLPFLIFGSFHLRDAIFFACLFVPFCVRFLLPLFSVVKLLFSFRIRWSRFRCFVSCFCVILASCVALLAASLSFLFFRCRCLFFLSGGFLLGIPGVVYYIPSLFDLLIILFGFLRLCLFLFCAFRSFPSGFPASSLIPWGISQSSSGYAIILRSQLGLPVLLCFPSVLGFSAPSFILRVWSACGFSFSVGALIRCNGLRQALPFSPVLVSSDVSLSVLRSWAEFSPIQWSLPYVVAVPFEVSIPSPCFSVSLGSVALFCG